MDNGTIVEFDTPANLIQMKDGHFRAMCLQSGMFRQLEEATLSQRPV